MKTSGKRGSSVVEVYVNEVRSRNVDRQGSDYALHAVEQPKLLTNHNLLSTSDNRV